MKIAVIGGTGALGAGFVKRLAGAGHEIFVGTRHPKAGGAGRIQFVTPRQAAAQGDLVIVAVPFAAQADTLRDIAEAARGKIVIDATVPLMPPRVAAVQLPPEGSAAIRARAVLGPDVRLVCAFHNIAAAKLAEDGSIDCDVMVFADDAAAASAVISLAGDMGMRGLHCGPVENAVAAEALTSVLIYLNRACKVTGAGIRFTGLSSRPREAA